MHPVEDIRGSKSRRLSGKRIVLGITGSIAAVECVKLARELARHDADVIPVMSEAAQRIIHPDSIHFATGHRPILVLDGAVKHVELCGDSRGRADLLLIAPATANTISKMAHGIDDTVVTTMASCALGSGMPVVVVPAMHSSMYNHGIITDNVKRLERAGVVFVGPRMEEKKAKMASRDEIILEVMRALGPGDLRRKRVLVMAGSTREPADEVRFLSNRSSGRTGIELYIEAYRRGATVELWAGEGMHVPEHIMATRFSSVVDLKRMCAKARADIVLVPAAISDFTVKRSEGKLSSERVPKLELTKAPRILELLRKNKKAKLVGFKAETGVSRKELEKRARSRLEAIGLDMVVANLIEDVGGEITKALILAKGRKTSAFEGKKGELAKNIFDLLLES